MDVLLSMTLTLVVLAQSPAKSSADQIKDDEAAARLTYMKDSVASLNLHPREANATSFRLLPDPIFRLNNSVSGVKDGSIFFWVDELGRPEAAIQVFLVPSGLWIHEFTALATASFVAEVGSISRWRPSKPGVEFKAIPNAPKPASTPEQRLRQMRTMAEGFAAEDNFETKGWNALRLLPKPLTRYGKAGSAVEDGALFAFVLGTDPEVFLMLEARSGKSGVEWQYALAPMTCYPVKGTCQGKEIWSLPLRLPASDPAETFYSTVFGKAQ